MKFCAKMLPMLVLGAMSLCGTAGTALAGPREDVLSAAQRCANLADDRMWLQCFYNAGDAMRSHLSLPATPAPATMQPNQSSARPAFGVGAVQVAPSGPPPMPRYKGGIYSGLFGSGKPAVANLRMSSYDFDRQGYFTVTLSDGEVWQQLDGDAARASWNKPASSYIVNVGQGALGTYNLMVNSDGISFKAHRIK
jgi:hypothetical protein